VVLRAGVELVPLHRKAAGAHEGPKIILAFTCPQELKVWQRVAERAINLQAALQRLP
jgi:hypothetical protein